MERSEALRCFEDLEERLPAAGAAVPGLVDPPSSAIVEIAGRDSVAAALAGPFAGTMLPTIVYTGTEFGDPAVLLDNVDLLRERLAGRAALLEPVVLGSPRWWAEVNGRPLTALQRAFGNPFVCVGCHMYLHAVRVLLAARLGVPTIVTGERESHRGRVKYNQSPPALDAYVEMAGRYGVELAQPLRHLDDEEELARLTGEWPEGGRQRGCVLSGNEGRPGPGPAEGPAALPPGLEHYLRDYLLPVTFRFIDGHLEGREFDARETAEVLLAAKGGTR